MHACLVQQDAVNKGGIFDGTTLTLLNLDVGQVNQSVTVFNHTNSVHGTNTNVGHEGFDSAGGFAGEGGLGHLLENRILVFSGDPMPFHQVDRSLSSEPEAFANNRRVNVLLDEVLTSLEQFTGENDR